MLFRPSHLGEFCFPVFTRKNSDRDERSRFDLRTTNPGPRRNSATIPLPPLSKIPKLCKIRVDKGWDNLIKTMP